MLKGLSFTQPWGTLVVTGEKEYETRSWKPKEYVGWIAIHASSGFPRWAKDMVLYSATFKQSLGKFGFNLNNLPVSGIIGLAEVVDYKKTEIIKNELSQKEIHFGDYSENRWAWKFQRPVLFKNIIPCKGALNLWNLTQDVEEKVFKELESYSSELVAEIK